MADQKPFSSAAVTGTHYTVLARRFRPQAFDDVIGQEHVSRALRNAIRSGRVAHAYLFTGARGVGKTSTARILAKALNCPNVQDGIPCNQCEICEGITAGNDVDVLEIDGASNRGIDDIRSLRANVGVRSMRTQYKVYIIDEVHMLTREAFNALLKTLEEPPPNVKFVFCTTEPNKVPDTILSRCQRFDFSAIGETSIAQRLGEIARAEGFEVQNEALELVARRARGSMRDSQSLFDQLLAFSEGTVTDADVHRMLGTAGDERLVELFSAIIEHRPGEVLTLLEDSLSTGVQAGELMDQAIGYVRDLMVIQAGGQSVSLCSVSARFRDDLADQAKRLGMHTIMAAFQVLADAKNQMSRSTLSRTILEMSLIQLSLLENLSALSELLSGRMPAVPDLTQPAGSTRPDPSGSPSVTPAADEKKKAESSLSGPPTSALTGTQNAQPGSLDNARTDGTVSPHPRTLTPQDHEAATFNDEAHDDEADTPQSLPELQLTDGNMAQLQKLLCTRLGLTVAGGLRQAKSMSLRPDHVVEVHVEETYAAARTSLELPANRALIQNAIQELTGQTVTLQIQSASPVVAASRPSRSAPTAPPPAGAATTTAETDRLTEGASATPSANSPEKSGTNADATQSATDKSRNGNQAGAHHGTKPAPHSGVHKTAKSKPPANSPAVNLLDDIDPSKDNFVQHVIDIFGATVVRIQPAPAVMPGQGAEDDAAE